MTPTEALSTIYAMRESIANGWKPNQDQEVALTLADMVDEIRHICSVEFKHGRESMRDEVCPVIFGQCSSDNVAQRTVDAIRKIEL